MALDVETGNGSSTAEAYLSVAEADAYHTRFGNAGWTGDDSVKEVAIRKATRYLDARYGRRWLGQRTNSGQALNWPRSFIEDSDGFYLNANTIPQRLKDACAMMALAALTEDIYADIDADSGSKTKSEIVVGPIEISDEFVGGAEAVKWYRLAEDLVAEYITTSGQITRG